MRKSATTRACVFGTIHMFILMEKLENRSKGFVGKVNMDRNSPDYLFVSLMKMQEWIKAFENIRILTPRFFQMYMN